MSVFHRLAAVTAAASLAAVGVLGLGVAPASADHVVDVSPTRCSAGPLGSGTGLHLTTTRTTVEVLPDGSTRYTCTFTGLPAFSSGEDNGYFDWSRPARALRTSADCATPDTIFFPGQALYTPTGMLRVVCVEPPVR